MSDFHKFKSSIIAKSLLFFALVCIFFVVIKVKVNLIGLGLGYTVSLINFYLLAQDTVKIHSIDKRGFVSLLIIRFFMRYGMIGLAMFAALKYELNIVIFIFGLFFVQLTLIADNFFQSRKVS